MIIKTKLTAEEESEVRKQFKTYHDIKRNFPNYVHLDAIHEGVKLLCDLFGIEMFKDIDPDLRQ